MTHWNVMPGARRELMTALKRRGRATLAQLADDLQITPEAVRQQLMTLSRDGWVATERSPDRRKLRRGGRPPAVYRLTSAGEELFPKDYSGLAVGLIDVVATELGPTALNRVLAAITDARVAQLAPAVAGRDLTGKLEALRAVYGPDDPFIEVEPTADGYRLIERNCPFLAIAQQRPQLCSTTVSLLTRLLGCRVIRERRFQEGHGYCAFRILPGEPVADPPGFEPEPAAPDGTGQ